jgi:hypothetical protein
MPANPNATLVTLEYQARNTQVLDKAIQTIRNFQKGTATKKELTLALRPLGVAETDRALRRAAAGAGKLASDTERIARAQDKVQAETKQTADAEARLNARRLQADRKRRAGIREEEALLRKLRQQQAALRAVRDPGTTRFRDPVTGQFTRLPPTLAGFQAAQRSAQTRVGRELRKQVQALSGATRVLATGGFGLPTGANVEAQSTLAAALKSGSQFFKDIGRSGALAGTVSAGPAKGRPIVEEFRRLAKARITLPSERQLLSGAPLDPNIAALETMFKDIDRNLRRGIQRRGPAARGLRAIAAARGIGALLGEAVTLATPTAARLTTRGMQARVSPAAQVTRAQLMGQGIARGLAKEWRFGAPVTGAPARLGVADPRNFPVTRVGGGVIPPWLTRAQIQDLSTRSPGLQRTLAGGFGFGVGGRLRKGLGEAGFTRPFAESPVLQTFGRVLSRTATTLQQVVGRIGLTTRRAPGPPADQVFTPQMRAQIAAIRAARFGAQAAGLPGPGPAIAGPGIWNVRGQAVPGAPVAGAQAFRAGFTQGFGMGVGSFGAATAGGGRGGGGGRRGAGGLGRFFFGQAPPDPAGRGILGRLFIGDDRRFRGFATAVRTVGQFAGASAIIFAFVSSIRDAIQAGIEFESVMARIQGVLPSKSQLDRLQIGDAVRNAAREFGVDLLQAAESAKIFAQQGLDAVRITEELGASLAAVQGIGLSATQARELLTAVRNITDEQVSSLEILDRISRIEARRAIDAGALADGLKQAAPLAKQFEGQFVGVVDALDLVLGATTTIVEQTRVSGRQAATSLRFILARLGRPQIIQQLEQIGGVRLGTAESGGRQLRPLVEILNELASAFERIKETKGTAEATKFLVALAGARQVNPAAVLLENMSRALETARLGATAFGDIQERLAIQLDTMKVRMQLLRTEFRIFGSGLIENSAIGEILKTTIGGLTTLLGGLGGAGQFTTVKLAALAAGGITLMRVFSALHRTMSFFAATGVLSTLAAGTPAAAARFGAARRLATGGLLTRGAVGLVRAAPGAGAAIGGLGLLLGPSGAATAAIIGLTLAIGALIGKFRELRRESSLTIKFLTQEDIDVDKIPALKQFTEFSQQIGTGPQQLLAAFKDIANVQFDRLSGLLGDEGVLTKNFPEGLRQLRDELGVTRFALVNELIGSVGGALPGFNEHLETLIDNAQKAADKPLTDLEIQTLKTAEAMRIFGQAVSINSGILGANLERLVSAANNAQNQISAAFAKTEQFFKERRREGRGVQLGIGPTREALESFLHFQTPLGLEELATGAGEAVPVTIETIRAALREGFEDADVDRDLTRLIIDFLTIDNTAIEYALKTAAEKGGRVDVDEFIGFTMDWISAQIRTDPQNYKQRLSTDLANFLFEAFSAGNIEELGFGILDKGTPFQRAMDLFTETFPEAIRQLRERLIGTDTDPEILKVMDRIVSEIGQGAKVANLALKAAFVNIRNPIDDFLKDFFIAEQRIIANTRAAEALGLAYDKLGEQLRNLQTFGQQLFGLDIDLLDQVLENVIRLSNAKFVGRTQLSEDIGSVMEYIAAQGRTADIFKGDIGQAAAGFSQISGKQQIDRLNAEIEVLQGILETTFGEGGDNLLATFQRYIADIEKIGGDSPATRRLIAFYKDFVAVSQRGRTELEAQGEVQAATAVEAGFALQDLINSWIIATRVANMYVDAQQRVLDGLKRQADFARQRVTAEKEVSQALIESRTKLATEGLAPIFREAAVLNQIIQQRNLELSTAEKIASVELEALRQRRAEKPSLSQDEIDEALRGINDRLILAREEAQINAEKELALQRQNLLYEQQNEFLTIQAENAQSRLQGIRELLTDINLLTSGAAFETFFGVPGQAFVERQADLLMDTLFNTRTGLLKEFSSVVGGSGEIITDAHVIGATLAAPILRDAIVTGAELAALGGVEAGAPEAALTRVIGAKGFTRIPGFGFAPAESEIAKIAAATLALVPGFGFVPQPAEFQLTRTPGFGFAPIPGKPVLEETDVEGIQLRQLAQAAATIGGNIAGSILGGKGAGAQAGAGFGTLVGGIAGEKLFGGVGGALGSAAGPVGTVVGGILGGLIGGLFDNEEQQFKALEIIARNTGESVTLLENTNKLLQPQGFTFNLPATFRLPAFNPSNFGGGAGGAGAAILSGASASSNAVNIQNHISVSVDGTQASSEVGREIASAVSRELSLQLSSNGLYVPRA